MNTKAVIILHADDQLQARQFLRREDAQKHRAVHVAENPPFALMIVMPRPRLSSSFCLTASWCVVMI